MSETRDYLNKPTPSSRRIERALKAKGYRVTSIIHSPYGLEPGSSYTSDFTYMRGGWEAEFVSDDGDLGRVDGGTLRDVLDFIGLLLPVTVAE